MGYDNLAAPSHERLAVSEQGECVVVRVDVRAATLRFEDGVLELRLPKALLPGFLCR